MPGDRLIRITTAFVVLGVAVIAAIVSYEHAYELVRTPATELLLLRNAAASCLRCGGPPRELPGRMSV
jgi:hypothetical protein